MSWQKNMTLRSLRMRRKLMARPTRGAEPVRSGMRPVLVFTQGKILEHLEMAALLSRVTVP